MAPAVILDTSDDFQLPAKFDTRTLLLAPPCVSSHPEALAGLSAAYDRRSTDIQMLDRLAMGFVELPATTYDLVLLLTSVAGAAEESTRLLTRDVMARVVASMKAGAAMQSQDGTFGRIQTAPERTEAILAGLVQSPSGEGMVKPVSSGAASQTVSLKIGKKRSNAAAVPANDIEKLNATKRKNDEISTGEGTVAHTNGNGAIRATPAGVEFINTDDDFDVDLDDDDDFPTNEELERAGKIDPDTLLTDADRQKPIIIPEACKPNSKRRRACKDCTCGLAQRLADEDREVRANADANLAKLSANDLNEVDFTVKGKVGSCGNCALGDAFRCDGCPYIGLPAFKPGEEVRLLSNDVQL